MFGVSLKKTSMSDAIIKTRLLEVFDTELGRINGLIDGISASQKGGNFTDGFQRGGDAFDRFEIADKALNVALQ